SGLAAGGAANAGEDLGARRMHADGRPAAESEQRVVGDEAFTVETPGGSVLGNRTEEPVYRAEPRPTLGAN
ncbi:hypothetical protein, partial [Luedemannella flava]|uniref:hypothetical protein n=1 Tax=Luedemannella flava TaxID=349316 RepID=UPI0031D98ABB